MYEHNNGEGANFTKKHLPVKLVYVEEFSRIDEAFYREKQVQGWSHAKKEALIQGNTNHLRILSKNYTQFGKPVVSTGSTTGYPVAEEASVVSVVSTGSTTGSPVTEQSSVVSTGSTTGSPQPPVTEPVEVTVTQRSIGDIG